MPRTTLDNTRFETLVHAVLIEYEFTGARLDELT